MVGWSLDRRITLRTISSVIQHISRRKSPQQVIPGQSSPFLTHRAMEAERLSPLTSRASCFDAVPIKRSHSPRLPRKPRLHAVCQLRRAAISPRLPLLVSGTFRYWRRETKIWTARGDHPNASLPRPQLIPTFAGNLHLPVALIRLAWDGSVPRVTLTIIPGFRSAIVAL